MKIQLGLSNYATKANLKGATSVNTSNLAVKSDLASLKAEVDKRGIHKLITVPADLSKLGNVQDNAVKKVVNDKLVTKVNGINNSRFVLKTQYNTDKSGLEKENAKIAEIEGKIPSITGF